MSEVDKGRQLLWQVEETAGFESSWIILTDLTLSAKGRAVGQLPEPYWLSYTLDTDEHAVTTRLSVEATTATGEYTLELRREGETWFVNDEARPDLAGARDCDLACSPLTNTMPIIRTGLHRGAGAERFLMAFVEIPALRVVPSRQSYTHLTMTEAGARIRYSAGEFSSDLEVDHDGLVVTYPTMASRVPATTSVTDGERLRGPGTARPGA